MGTVFGFVSEGCGGVLSTIWGAKIVVVVENASVTSLSEGCVSVSTIWGAEIVPGGNALVTISAV